MKVKLRESRKSFNIQSIITPFRENHQKFASTASSRTVNNIISIPLKSARSNGGPKLRFALWNARSINNKISSICDLVISEHIDICAVTETWLTGIDCFTMADLINTFNHKIIMFTVFQERPEVVELRLSHAKDFKSREMIFPSTRLSKPLIWPSHPEINSFVCLQFIDQDQQRKTNSLRRNFFLTSRNFLKNSSLHPTSLFWLAISIFM